jgi:hypothetical protein
VCTISAYPESSPSFKYHGVSKKPENSTSPKQTQQATRALLMKINVLVWFFTARSKTMADDPIHESIYRGVTALYFNQ